eukprot:1150298-Prymnesium_polylepis.1
MARKIVIASAAFGSGACLANEEARRGQHEQWDRLRWRNMIEGVCDSSFSEAHGPLSRARPSLARTALSRACARAVSHAHSRLRTRLRALALALHAWPSALVGEDEAADGHIEAHTHQIDG